MSTKSITTIRVDDNRGTMLSVTLYLSSEQIADYVGLVGKEWNDQWGGNTDSVMVNGKIWKPASKTASSVHSP